MNKTIHEFEAEAIGLKLGDEVKRIITSEFPKLSEIWTELWNEEERHQRQNMLHANLVELCSNWMDDILSKEAQTREEFISRVEELLEEIGRLELELNVKIPYSDVQSLPLQCMAKQLNQKLERYRQMKDLRVNKLRELRDLECSLVEALGVSPVTMDLPAVPTEQQLEDLQHHVQNLEAEKLNRMGIFMEKRQRAKELFNQLGSKPSLLFENDVVDEDRTTNFKVTDENMTHLANMVTRLEHQAQVAQQRRDDLLEKLTELWGYLEEPLEQSQNFLQNNPGITQADLNALKAELERCKKEKSANIGKFVIRIRETLVQQWDKCLVSNETRNQLRVFKLNCFNEDVYDLHELELKRWQNFYSENQRLFDLYAKHTALFEKLLELDGRGKSANRYQNRGGQLLLEEKQRKLVAKDLPRVEGELRAALAEFEEKHGEPFTSFGRPLVEVVDEKWSSNFDQKTINRFRDGTCNARTPLAVKRPAATTCSTGGKMIRMAPPTPSVPKPPMRAARRLLKSNKEQQPEPDSTIHLEPSYDAFQETLKTKLATSKLVSRSTEVLTPRKVLREKTQPIISTRSSPAHTNLRPLPSSYTPKTVPRRGRPADQPKTPRGRLPCIL